MTTPLPDACADTIRTRHDDQIPGAEHLDPFHATGPAIMATCQHCGHPTLWHVGRPCPLCQTNHQLNELRRTIET